MACNWLALGLLVLSSLICGSVATPEDAPAPTKNVIDRTVFGLPYFWLSEGELKCFYEELNPTTHVLVHYKAPHLDHEVRARDLNTAPSLLNGIGIEVYVNGPDGYPVWLPQHHQVLTKPEDSFGFDSTTAGEYEICMRTNGTHWHQHEQLKMHLQIDTGVDTVDWKEVAVKSHLDDLHVKVRELKAKMNEIIQDQTYLRARDARFRQTSESTFTRVWAFALLQVAIFFASATYQMLSFKKFLISKKLV
jgi:hypothetical protein